MNRTVLVTLAALALSCAAAWRLGGTLGTGVLAGFLCGASVAGLGAAWQMHVIRTRPERVLWATAQSFLFKLFAVLAFALVFRFVDGASERVDWRSFLVTFAAAVFVVMILGAFDNARALKRLAPPRAELAAERGAA
jgi:hypothetical protein